MIQMKRKEDCCGCGACAQICKKDAIEMQADTEGFLYPTVNEDVCTNCGLCDHVCPVRNSQPETPVEQKGYLAQNRNDSILTESTSGGVFTALASWILRRDGSVFGAVMGDDFTVFHTHAETLYDLASMRGSKYVQSEIRNSYKEAEDKLKSGQAVLFSGTPCQIEGLLSYLGKDYPNLLTADVVCHACPSPEIWKAYTIMMLTQADGQISRFLFRDKTRFGYQMSTMSSFCGSQNIYSEGIAVDPYLRAFFSDICDRPSCYECRFKKRYRSSDLTMWDCFDPSRFKPDIPEGLDLKKGVSCVLAHSAKGKIILKELNADLRLYPVSPDELAESAHEMRCSVKMNNDRERFFADALSLQPEELFSRYFPVSWKNKGEDAIRKICLKFGIYNCTRKVAKHLLPRFKRR